VLEITHQDARRILLLEQGLLADPQRKATPTSVLKLVRQLGFVQLDSIPVIDRAHHLTLRARLEGYRPKMLKRLIEHRRALFEHWTHDASVIPVEWLHYWRHRCSRFLAKPHVASWLETRIGKADSGRVIAETLGRIRDEGPLRSRDFAAPEGGGDNGWWRWKPHKAALEYLWWSGELTISGRDGFQKIYGITELCYPEAYAKEEPTVEEMIDFACTEALARLGCGTPAEIAAYFDLVTLPEARQWCADSAEEGTIQSATVEGNRTFAVNNFTSRLRRAEKLLESHGDELRFLSPFDPIIRDRKRALRLFDFDYRFEAYVPQPKRIYGYYVLPILQRDQITGRCDLKYHRDQSRLEMKGIWWEKKLPARAEKRRSRLFDHALSKLEEYLSEGA